ncbi:MAG: c-type cytochrome [Thiobacillaceae bacterium]
MCRGVWFALAAAGLAMVSIAHASSTIEALARTCNNCHGVNGVSAGESMPSIGGLPEGYLKNVMMEWKEGKRYSATMGRLIKGYTEEEISGLAAFQQTALDPGGAEDRPQAGRARQTGDPVLRQLPRPYR